VAGRRCHVGAGLDLAEGYYGAGKDVAAARCAEKGIDVPGELSVREGGKQDDGQKENDA
jgi:hypothetical protein